MTLILAVIARREAVRLPKACPECNVMKGSNLEVYGDCFTPVGFAMTLIGDFHAPPGAPLAPKLTGVNPSRDKHGTGYTSAGLTQ
jgi:hypothetical protein